MRVWQEVAEMTANVAQAERDYQANFIHNNYHFDVNASDLKLTQVPSEFSNGRQTENVYRGRTPLTPGAGHLLTYHIEQYLMGLTLLDLKTMIVANYILSDELDYQLDRKLITWAKTHFTLTGVPPLIDPATMSGEDKKTAITNQQNIVARWLRTQPIFRLTVKQTDDQGQTKTTYKLVDLTDARHFPPNWYKGKPILRGKPGQPALKTFAALTSDAEQAQDPL